jgi:dihydroorotate dehydrogenase (NAD+) catalytic subunit
MPKKLVSNKKKITSQMVYPSNPKPTKPFTNGQQKESNSYIHPEQPTFIYDITKPWEEVVKEDPIWLSQKFPPLPKLYNFLGKQLISPIIIGAGPASGKLWTDFYFKMGYGAVIQKTQRTMPRPSNKVPNVAIIKSDKSLKRSDIGKPLIASLNPEDFNKYQSITNSFGNPSPDMQIWASELVEQKKAVQSGQMLGCSVTATMTEDGGACVVILNDSSSNAMIMQTATDLLMAASAAASAGADFVELNLACPNVTENSEEGEMFQNAKLVEYTFAEFKKRFPQTPIGFKFGLYKDKDQMRRVFSQAGDNLTYVSGINAVAMPVTDDKGKNILPGRSTSGVCGKILKNIALEHIRWAAEIREEEGLKYEILGGGGILTPKDVEQFLESGANAVQVSTIAMTNPLFANEYSMYNQKAN